jgi:hypothetical protein
MAFILSETVPSMPNKVWRFYLFVRTLGAIEFCYQLLQVQLLGYPDMDWTGASITADCIWHDA